MSTSSEISFYTDMLIIEAMLQDDQLIKRADGGLVASFTDKIKDLVAGHFDPNDKVGSLMNILGPGVLYATLSAMGFKKIGLLIGLLMNVFHVDVNGILRSIWDKLGSAVSGDKKVSSTQIDEFVNSALQEHVKPISKEQAEKEMAAKSYSQIMSDVRFTKLAMEEYKIAVTRRPNFDSFYDSLMGRQNRATTVLGRILSWVFKIAFASAGLLVAGDVINKFLGRPNALDKTLDKGKPTTQEPQAAPVPAFVAKQKKFPVKPGYTTERHNTGESLWMEQVQNNESSIEQMLINFAKDVYSGLDGKEEIIRNSPAFHILKDRISWYNHASPDAPMVYLPRYFTSKKQIVDYFIDDVAEKSP